MTSDHPSVMTAAFTHCALHVRDVAASIAFYRRYCGLEVVRAYGAGADRTVWLAAPGQERPMVLVLVPGGAPHRQAQGDITHYGFAVPSRAAVDALAERGRQAGCLHWEPQDLGPPAGYLCALRDPDGYVIEFSHGQPLGHP